MEMREIHWLMDLITHIDLGLVVFDSQGRIKVWNHFMENHSGLSSTEMRERCLWEVYPDLQAEWFQHELEAVFLLESEVFITWEQVPHLFPFMLSLSGRPGCPLCANTLQQHRRRFIIRVLRRQPALEGSLEHRLPQPPGAGQRRHHRCLQRCHHRQPPLHLGDDAALFGERR